MKENKLYKGSQKRQTSVTEHASLDLLLMFLGINLWTRDDLALINLFLSNKMHKTWILNMNENSSSNSE